MNASSRWLTVAALLCFGIALLHGAMIFMGPDAYVYFGAPQLGRAEARGYAYPDQMTVGLVLVFSAFGAYALSGAGRMRRLPLLRIGLVLIGAVFTLRGLRCSWSFFSLRWEMLRCRRGSSSFRSCRCSPAWRSWPAPSRGGAR